MFAKYIVKSIFLLSLLLISTTSYAAVFFVSTTGNDSNTGSIDSPFATLQKAISLVGPGDTIYIREGIYQQQSYIYTSGTPENYIKIMAYNNEAAVFDGNNTLTRFIKIGDYNDREHTHYIWIEGLEIRNFYNGIVSVPGSSNNVFKNIHVHHNSGDGIVTYRDNDLRPGGSGSNLIENVHAEYNKYHGIKISGVGNKVINCIVNNNGYNIPQRDGNGLQVSDNNWDVVIDGIISFNNEREGIRINAKPHKTTKGADVKNVTSYNNGRSGLQLAGSAEGITISNLLAYGNGTRGLSIDTNVKNVDASKLKLYNNAGQGIRIAHTSSGIEISDIKVFGNSDVGILMQDTTSNISISEGLIYGNDLQGVLIRGRVNNVQVSNSSIYKNGRHGFAVSEQSGVTGVNRNISFSRSITYDNRSRTFLIGHVDNLMIENNNVYTESGNIENEIDYRENYTAIVLSKNLINFHPTTPEIIDISLAFDQ